MIITSSEKPIRIIGFVESTITQEGLYFISAAWEGDIAVITPAEFLLLPNKKDYQYLVFFTIDVIERIKIIDIIETMKLECFSYVHDTVVIYQDLNYLTMLGHGSFIAPFSTVLLGATIGKHCIIETYCLVSHYCKLGTNVILHSGTMIAGRTTIGNNCMFNFKSTSLNALTICDNVEVGAISTVTKNITMPGRYIGTIARYAGELIPFNE